MWLFKFLYVDGLWILQLVFWNQQLQSISTGWKLEIIYDRHIKQNQRKSVKPSQNKLIKPIRYGHNCAQQQELWLTAVDEVAWPSNKDPGGKNPEHMLMLHGTYIPILFPNYFSSLDCNVAKTFAVYIQVYLV
jgi:hypothetical protein